MKQYFLISLLACLCFWGCDKATFKSFQELPGNRWVKNDVRIFKMEITDDVTPHQLNMELRHAGSILLPSIQMAVQMTSPSGESETKQIDLQLKDEHGEFKGEGTVDIWDLCCFPLTEKKVFQKGTYTIGFTQLTKYEYIPGVMGIGIRLEK